MTTETELREKLATCTRIFAMQEMLGLFGHISVFDPKEKRVYMSPAMGFDKATVTADDIVVGDLNGKAFNTNQRFALEWPIHMALHGTRDDAIAVAHLSDIGGRQWAADAGEMYEEGIRFPVIKLAEEGRMNPWVMQMLEANVRLPQQVRGDIEAQMGALRVAERRLIDLLQEYRLPDIREIAEAIFKASQEAALRELRQIPPGVYVGSVESDGWDERVRIQATLTVTADGVTIDYSGSTAQVRYGINETFNHTYAYSIYPFKCLLSPGIPNKIGRAHV